MAEQCEVPSSRLPLSVMMATLNAEKTIAQALKSVSWAKEIIVVDSQSTDNTVKIAESFGAKVFQRKFDGYGNQKQFGVNQCKEDWILVLDSDESLSSVLQAEIQSIVLGSSQYDGYELPRELWFLGHRIRNAGGVDFPLRFFRRNTGAFNGAPVHEKIVVQGKVGRLQGWLRHDSYFTLEDYFRKFDRYTSLGAQECFEKGKKVSDLRIALTFPAMFFKFYFLKGGIKDGLYGWVWCLFSASYPVVKYTKLRQLWTSARTSV